MQEYKLYNGKVVVKFDGENDNHKFYDINGNPLLSVTGITSIIDKSQGLMGWAVKLMGQYLLNEMEKGNNIISEELVETAKRKYREVQKDARDVGSEIHNWINQWILGKNPEMPSEKRVLNGITAFLKFQKENQLKWVESERCVYSRKYNYVGFLDAIAMKGKKRILVDFKSSNGIYPEMILQVAGYQIAWEEETGKRIDESIILQFHKETGEFNVKTLDDNDKERKKAFLAALTLVKYLKGV